MRRQDKVLRYLVDPDFRFIVNAARGLYNDMSDDEYIRRMFKAKLGYDLNLDNPRTFNEKLNWLKIHDRKSVYTTMVDKYTAKKYIAAHIGEEYVIPTLGVWDKFDDIVFNTLPNNFVLKTTHDSGGIIICTDKSKLDIESVSKKLNNSLRRNYYYYGREWPYKGVKPRIIAEELLQATHGEEIRDYKLQCFGGKFDNIFVAEGRFSKRGVRYHYFDCDWNYIPYCPYNDIDIDKLKKMRPSNFEEMIGIAEKLSAGFSQLRVDLYEIAGKVYFGELTFYSQSGFDTDITHEADCILGDKLTLPDLRTDKEMNLLWKQRLGH